MSDSALIYELAQTRGALLDAIEFGEKIQARNDAALAIARKWAESPSVRELIAALEGKS